MWWADSLQRVRSWTLFFSKKVKVRARFTPSTLQWAFGTQKRVSR
jgi:hypothetical protein